MIQFAVIDIGVLLGYVKFNLSFYNKIGKRVITKGGELGMDKQNLQSEGLKSKVELKKPVKSSTLKCGKRTYFFDVNLASNNKKYLKITESRFVEEGQDRKRNSFILFPEDAINFQSRLTEIVSHLS